MSESFLLSLVVPMRNEAQTCAEFFSRTIPILESVTAEFEIICVDDGSDDGTRERLTLHAARDARIKFIGLTRNFGKEAALTAGIDHAAGDVLIPIDADLQDPPELIPQLIDKWREGYDIVLAIRKDRSSDTLGKRVTAKLFYKIIGRLAEVSVPENAGDFRLMSRRVVDTIKTLPERTRFMKGLFSWVGYRSTALYYTREPRVGGQTKWKYSRLWNFALEGILSFTTAPLKIWSYLGFLVASFALAYMGYIIIRTLVLGVDVPGYASLIVAVTFFSGLNMIGLGIIGEYLGRVYIEVKNRPLYLVEEKRGFGRAAVSSSEPVKHPASHLRASRS